MSLKIDIMQCFCNGYNPQRSDNMSWFAFDRGSNILKARHMVMMKVAMVKDIIGICILKTLFHQLI